MTRAELQHEYFVTCTHERVTTEQGPDASQLPLDRCARCNATRVQDADWQSPVGRPLSNR